MKTDGYYAAIHYDNPSSLKSNYLPGINLHIIENLNQNVTSKESTVLVAIQR